LRTTRVVYSVAMDLDAAVARHRDGTARTLLKAAEEGPWVAAAAGDHHQDLTAMEGLSCTR
jgi:hypothetical protein